MDTTRTGVTRRSFLVGGSAAGIAITHGVRSSTSASATVPAGPGAVVPVPAGRRWAPVGFVGAGSGRPVTTGTHLVVPVGLTIADRTLEGPIRLTVHGLRGAADTVPFVRLVALWPGPGGGDPLRFHVWQSGSPGVGYTVHVGDGSEPAFDVHVGDRTSGIRFATDDEPGVPSLRRGTYLLGLLPDAWRRPSVVWLDDPAMPPSLLVTVG